MYDTTLGRFIQRDPSGPIAWTNPYEYTDDRPTNRKDPSGHGPTQDVRSFRKEYEENRKRYELTTLERFTAWYDRNRDTSWTKLLPDCPCNTKIITRREKRRCRDETHIVTEVVGAENPDPSVWDDAKSWQLSFFRTFWVDFHPGATYDMRSKIIYAGAGQQCTYDSSGNLITHGPGAGTPDKGHSATSAHSWQDVDPFIWALELDGGKPGKYVNMYLELRPPNNGNNCAKNP